ncbi:unnamed protein product [Cylicocyclus nassatus]|uniref:Uncharacterized protein n=1 Tax=Cylicocyclus nassatus TaxID=53992 RepID=A0AA36H1H2_CYLNA|nr:unnamed protein product [Cylicocyclus nassatus]
MSAHSGSQANSGSEARFGKPTLEPGGYKKQLPAAPGICGCIGCGSRGILDYKMRTEKENFEKQSLSDWKINKELSREVMEVTEDLYTLRKLIPILKGTRDVSMLEEQFLKEERILSHLVRGEVKRTYVRIQADFTVIVEVEVYDRRTLGKKLQCSLRTSSNYHYKFPLNAIAGRGIN